MKKYKAKLPNTNTLAELQVRYKYEVCPSNFPNLKEAEDVYNYIIDQKCFDDDTFDHTEQMIIILTNRAGKAIGWKVLSKGGIGGTVMDPLVVYQTALLANASRIILAHNHPSGSNMPSGADKRNTKTIVDGCKILGIDFGDHLIITRNGYFSMYNNGDI